MARAYMPDEALDWACDLCEVANPRLGYTGMEFRKFGLIKGEGIRNACMGGADACIGRTNACTGRMKVFMEKAVLVVLVNRNILYKNERFEPVPLLPVTSLEIRVVSFFFSPWFFAWLTGPKVTDQLPKS